MLRFGRVFDLATEADLRRMAEVKAIFRKAFPSMNGADEKIEADVRNRAELGYDLVLLTVEGPRPRVVGFALAHYYAEIRYAYLDYIAVDPDTRTRGLGSALYEALREYVLNKGARGLFLEVPPDDPKLVADPAVLPGNRARVRFYERYAAFPILNTDWEKPAPGERGDYDPPYLVFDGLGLKTTLSREATRKAMRLILARKYGWPPESPYVKSVVRSVLDDPVKLRGPRQKAEPPQVPSARHGRLRPLKVLVTKLHETHHVKERGYVEKPVRMSAIMKGLNTLPIEVRPVRRVGEAPIRAVHDKDFVSYLELACANLGPTEALYPYVFPIRRPDRKPKDRAMRAGYYCIDTFTPLSRGAYAAARAAVDCAVSGADLVMQGEHLVYSLCRPPGHHAERRVFGGFCYFNNGAIAAHMLSEKGRVAFLDIDYHHGNGSQDIFYGRDDVLFISIHGHPNIAYPYFSGFADERGEGDGRGYNINYPLLDIVDDKRYLKVLGEALQKIRLFKPWVLVVSLGLDTMRNDPTGTFLLTPAGMREIGGAIGNLDLPTLVIQEGGYLIRNLGRGALSFFSGLSGAWY